MERLSSENTRAREGGREGENRRNFPMNGPFSSSLSTLVSLSSFFQLCEYTERSLHGENKRGMGESENIAEGRGERKPGRIFFGRKKKN